MAVIYFLGKVGSFLTFVKSYQIWPFTLLCLGSFFLSTDLNNISFVMVAVFVR